MPDKPIYHFAPEEELVEWSPDPERAVQHASYQGAEIAMLWAEGERWAILHTRALDRIRLFPTEEGAIDYVNDHADELHAGLVPDEF